MKKLLTILTLIFCFAFTSKAQYVAMKDSAVMSYFKLLCPTCFKGDSLNSGAFMTATSNGSPTSVDISNRGVKDISDFKYFGWGGQSSTPPYYNYCRSFNCSHNAITTLQPVFKYAGIFNFQFSLSDFDCSYNNISDSAIYLFNTVGLGPFNYYNLSHNQIPKLPDFQFSSELNTFMGGLFPIDLSYNALSGNINLNFSSGIKTIDLSNNNIDSVTIINDVDKYANYLLSINSINLSNNKLRNLPLVINTNPLSNYEAYAALNLSNNLITNLPNNFSDYTDSSSVSIDISGNNISYLPPLGTKLGYLNCKNTQITCLPKLHNGLNILIDSPQIHCIPNYGSFTVNGKSSLYYPICNPTNNPNNCPILSTTPANYVNIPDTNFGKFLIAQYPSCLYKDSAANKYYMDTTCGAVVSETFMFCRFQNIADLTGVTYFKNLLVLNCMDNLLTTLPQLPKNLDTLDCRNNSINSLPQLPNVLTSLLCDNNNLYCLSQQLPSTLTFFNCDTAKIKCLPNIPSGLATTLPICNTTNNPNNCPTTNPYINIPDTNFGKFLIAQYPSCLYKDTAANKYYMDTTCGAVVSEDTLKFKYGDFSLKNFIYRINGIEYFKNLVYLRISSHRIDSVYNLPKRLKYLDMSNNYNSIFSPYITLPDSLRYLNISRSSTLPELPILPNSLEYLDCSFNSNPLKIVSIPNNLVELHFRETGIDSLPTLPNTLKVLEGVDPDIVGASLMYQGSSLKYITNIPLNLEFLALGLCPLQAIPNLPNTLKDLHYSDLTLASIPAIPTSVKRFSMYIMPQITNYVIPNTLEELYIDKNNYTVLPFSTLPNTIRGLGISDNKLTQLPKLPDSLYYLYCSENNNLSCLPILPPKLAYADFTNTLIVCLPNMPNGLTTLIPNTLPICNPTNNPNQCYMYPSVSGNVFTDNNSNSIKDTLEFYRPFVKLSLNNGQTTYSNLQGAYGISIDTLGTYTLKVTPPRYFKAVPDSVTVNFTANTSVILPDIALQPITSVDSFAIHITKLNRPRPGFKYAYNVSYGNVGTVSSATNNIIPINYDTSKLHFDSASVAVTINGTNNAPIEVNAGKLIAGQGGSFNLYFTVKTTVPIGDSIKTAATITYSGTKVFDVDSAIVTSSFDPNDKQATPTLTPVQIQNGDYIEYTIRFQNTGNDTAVNIVVSDTLSNLLLYNNIQVVASSHSSNISYSIGNGIIYFEFLNINLPPAITNEPLSHGFVRFRVRAVPTLATGVIIPNKANIYFDYNQPIITNTATTQIKAIVTPVRIIKYEAKIQNSKSEVQNNWQVGVEINVSHYVVQRSENGRDFTSVGEVAAQGLNSYSYTDKLPANYASQTVYYRLKIVDKDGKISYSEIKKLSTTNQQLSTINIYPNPAKDIVNIDVVDGKQLLIIDAVGKTVKQLNNITTHQTINTKQFTKGVYMVKVIMNNGEVKTSKLIIE